MKMNVIDEYKSAIQICNSGNNIYLEIYIISSGKYVV